MCEVDGYVGYEVGYGNSGVIIMEFFVGIDIINEDDEVFVVGFVMDFGLGRFVVGYFDGGMWGLFVVVGF